jgi:hypothetical protein
VTPQNRLDGFYQHIFRIGDPSLAIIGQVSLSILLAMAFEHLVRICADTSAGQSSH